VLTCFNQHSAAVIEWSKAVLRLKIATTSIQGRNQGRTKGAEAPFSQIKIEKKDKNF